MMTILMLAAAANAPVTLARDDAQWSLFVRTSLQRQAAAPGARLRQLQGTVRALGNDSLGGTEVAGPSGL
jgi:hypothetical protein